jgi:hypothetical protein
VTRSPALIIGAVVIAQAMAYATIAGLPVQIGLYTALVPPDLDLIGPLLPAAAGLALMSFVESIAAGRAVTHVDEHDRELIALGTPTSQPASRAQRARCHVPAHQPHRAPARATAPLTRLQAARRPDTP